LTEAPKQASKQFLVLLNHRGWDIDSNEAQHKLLVKLWCGLYSKKFRSHNLGFSEYAVVDGFYKQNTLTVQT
jgi:hypothetical protein